MKLIVALICLFPLLANAATSVTRYGITWFFEHDETVGQYVSGDWWVIAPVTITNITPQTVTSNATIASQTVSVTRNGTMLNPRAGFLASGTNGWDTLYLGSGYALGLSPYSNYLNVALSLPLTLTTNSSVVSTWSKEYSGSDIRPSQVSMQILTVVEEEPASGSFRPQPYGGSKVQTKTYSDLNWAALRTETPPASTPSFASVEQWFRGYVPEAWHGQGVDQYTRPTTNCPDNYPADASEDIGDALCLVNLDYTQSQKSNLVVWLTQYGIDVYGAALDGAYWTDLGGLSIGRKAPLLFAGKMLTDSTMIARANGSNYFIFQEDLQMWYVSTTDTTQPYTYYTNGGNFWATNTVGRLIHAQEWNGTVSNAPLSKLRVPYIEADLGMAEWGDQHDHFPPQDGRNLDAAYRDINLRALNRVVPAMRLMGLEDEWNFPQTFDYHDRIWAINQTNGLPATDWEGSALNWYSAWASNMWVTATESGGEPDNTTGRIMPLLLGP